MRILKYDDMKAATQAQAVSAVDTQLMWDAMEQILVAANDGGSSVTVTYKTDSSGPARRDLINQLRQNGYRVTPVNSTTMTVDWSRYLADPIA